MTPEQRARLVRYIERLEEYAEALGCQEVPEQASDLRAALALIDALAAEVARLNAMRTHCEHCGGDYLATGLETGCPCRLTARATAAEQRVAELERERDQARALYSTALEQAETYDEQAALTIRTEMARAEQAEARLREEVERTRNLHAAKEAVIARLREVEAERDRWIARAKEAYQFIGSNDETTVETLLAAKEQAEQTAAALREALVELRRAVGAEPVLPSDQWMASRIDAALAPTKEER